MKKTISLSIALIAGLVLLISFGMADRTDGLKVGDTATDFNLRGTDDQMYSLKDVKDAKGEDAKGWIVTFTCNTCPVAKAYEDRLIELHNKMSPKGYPVVAIQPNDPGIMPGDSFGAMKKKGYPFVYLFDKDQTVFPEYGATRTPEVYLLDDKRKLLYTGAIDDNSRDASAVKHKYVEEAIEAIENGRKPDPDFTKAIGCSIKVKRS